MQQYESSSFYHYVMYFFPSLSLMQKYIAQAEEKIGKARMGKFMFFFQPDLSSGQYLPESIKGIYQDREITLAEVLKK